MTLGGSRATNAVALGCLCCTVAGYIGGRNPERIFIAFGLFAVGFIVAMLAVISLVAKR